MSRVTKFGRRLLVSYSISAAVWLSIGLLGDVQDHFNNLTQGFDVRAIVAGLLFFISVAILTPPVFYLGKRLPVLREGVARPLIVYAIGAPLFSFAYACVRWSIAPPWSNALHQFVSRSTEHFWHLTYSRFVGLLWIYLEILLTANALVYFERARSEALDRAELEKALAASELQLLKTQLRPHFLFNTLHGISTLMSEDPSRASEMILQLAKLLRATVEHSNSDLTSLRDELKFISAYLDLEKMRLGSRLILKWSIDESVNDAQVPHMLLLPLVENAIVHGVASSRQPGMVEVTAERVGRNLRITVTNSIGSRQTAGTGVGLKNTQSRLRYLYGEDAELQFTKNAIERGAIVVVNLPLLFTSEVSPAAIAKEA